MQLPHAQSAKVVEKTTWWQLDKGLSLLNGHKSTIHKLYTAHTESDLQSACVILASLTFWSVVRLLIRTVIICRGMCWTRLARAMEGSNEGSEMINTLCSDMREHWIWFHILMHIFFKVVSYIYLFFTKVHLGF